MSRKEKERLVGTRPEFVFFQPEGISNSESIEQITMTLDEFETVRLLDLEKLTQEEAARHMEVARTTVTAIYERAREKLAQVLVYGKCLTVEGGNVRFCKCPSEGKEIMEKGENQMRIAVTYDNSNGTIWQHFGKTEFFKVYDVTDGKITGSSVESTNGQGHGALAGVLKALGADTLICGGIGGGAQNCLKEAGIKLYGGCTGDADAAVSDFLAGKLNYQSDIRCDHHHDGHHEGGCSGKCGE